MQNAAAQTDSSLIFEAFGVRVRLAGDTPDLVELGWEIAEKALVGRLFRREDNWEQVDHVFEIHRDENGKLSFTHQGQNSGSFPLEVDFRRLLNTMIRVHVAESARGWVFIHAGVVGWRGRAIIMPGTSHSGKTTLVSELIRLGAEYYSDEYAVLDPSGMVHPYERNLSVRPPGSEVQVQIPPSEFGANIGSKPVSVGMVALAKFVPDSVFQPETLSLGLGIMETVPEIIPIRVNADFSLKVLNAAFRSAIIVKSLRGEASSAARSILSLFDDNFNLAN